MKKALGFLSLTGFLVLAAVGLPESDRSICFSKLVLDASCPGCGLTRSVTAAAHLELTDSIEFHPLGPLVLLGIVGLWLIFGWAILTGRDLPPLDTFRWPAVLLIAALVIVWGFRLASGTLP